MPGFLERLKQRKLIQWALGYVVTAFAFLQGAQLLSQTYGWPEWVMRVLPVALAAGLVLSIIVAWYHGERGGQRVHSTEAALLGLVTALGLFACVVVARRAPVRTQRAEQGPDTARVIRVSVLPFVSMDTAYALMADAISDEIRGKLALLPGIDVIDRESSVSYRATKKTLQQIAGELEVEYVLTGRVRSQAATNGAVARIQVTPELVQVADRRSAPVTRWGGPIEAELTDVFAVQSRIANEVAKGMNVALTSKDRAALEERPTKSLEAWDEYNARFSGFGGGLLQPAAYLAGVRHLQRAVELDPSFIKAWHAMAGLAGLAQFYKDRGDTTSEAATLSRQASEQAMQLDPDYLGPAARAEYLQWVKSDYAGAADLLRSVISRYPNRGEASASLCVADQFLGEWPDAAVHCSRAADLNPRSDQMLGRAASSYAIMGDLQRALQLNAQSRVVRIEAERKAPENTEVMIRMAVGDLEGARGVLRRAMTDRRQGNETLSSAFDHYWPIFERPQAERILAVGIPKSDTIATHNYRMRAYLLLGDTAKARREAAVVERMQTAHVQKIKEGFTEAQNRIMIATAQMVLGKRAEALSNATRAAALTPIDGDGISGSRVHRNVAWLYLMCGDRGRAMGELKQIVARQRNVTAAFIRVDPRFDALHGDPQFEKLFTGPR